MKKKKRPAAKSGNAQSATLATADRERMDVESKTTVPGEQAVQYMRNWSIENKK